MKEGKSFPLSENIPHEEEFEIFINDDHFSKVTITPFQEREFLVGHLYSKKALENKDQIKNLKLVDNRFQIEIDPLPEGEPSYSREMQIDPAWKVPVHSIQTTLKSTLDSELYLKTGGTHSSSLCKGDVILASAEDVGRLNTLDKILGWGILNNVNLKNCYVVTSGRITSHTMEKLMHAGIPLTASKGAISSLAVELAQKRNLTLVGFVREERMSVYTSADRVHL